MRKIQICRLLAGVLVLVMVLGMIPIAFATGEEESENLLETHFCDILKKNQIAARRIHE